MDGKSPLSKAWETRPTFIPSKKDWPFSMEPNVDIVVREWWCKWAVFLNKIKDPIPLKTLKMCWMATYVGVPDTDPSWTRSKPLPLKVLPTLKMSAPKNATGNWKIRHLIGNFILKPVLVLYQILFVKSHWQSPVQRVRGMVLSHFSQRFNVHLGSAWDGNQLQIGLWQYWTR